MQQFALAVIKQRIQHTGINHRAGKQLAVKIDVARYLIKAHALPGILIQLQFNIGWPNNAENCGIALRRNRLILVLK